MKKYIVAVILVLVFPVMGYAKCCDCGQEKYSLYTPYTPILATTTVFGSVTSYKVVRDTGIKKLIGKMVHRTSPRGSTNDKSFMSEPRKLLDVTNKYLILSSDILASGQFKIERDDWDDGNWEEVVKLRRLNIVEMIGTETFHIICYGEAKYHCVRCGKSLRFNPVGYYCTSCKTGFNIKEE